MTTTAAHTTAAPDEKAAGPAASGAGPRGPRPRARRAGGMNLTFQRIELARMLANPWTMVFSVVMPGLLYLLFGAAPAYGREALPHGNVAGLVMANMALFGAMSAATNVAGGVSDERASGWTRQLRLTPLRGSAYVGTKLVNALILGLVVVAVTFALGYATGARLDAPAALAAFAVAWIGGTALFAAFGLAVGYLFAGEAVLGAVGPLMSLFAFFGGVFIPLSQLGPVMSAIGAFTPMYGVRALVEASVAGDALPAGAAVNAVVWFVLFAGLAAWRYARVAGRP